MNFSRSERETRTLTEQTLAEAVRAIRTDGFVVLDDVVSHDHLDRLWDPMVSDLKMILEQPEPPHQFVYGNVQQDPPPFHPYVFTDLIENPWVNQITRHVLGDGVYNRFYSGNTNIPGSKLQPVHVDGGDLWPDLEAPQPAHHLIVNIALNDVTEENGSIELWPGSHVLRSNVLGEDIKVAPALLDQRRRVVPPIRGNTSKGSILIRDNRLWHRGTPNTTDQPRFMIALIHTAPFIARKRPVVFSSDVADVFPEDATTDYRLSTEPIPYLTRHRPYDYPTQGHI